MHILTWFSPNRFNLYFSKLVKLLIVIAVVLVSISLYCVFNLIPDDYLQKQLVKIMYIHVPIAWLALFFYVCLSTFAILFLIYRNPFYDIISNAFAGIGMCMTLITLATGAIWGKPAWGAWWVWDARLTSMLLLFFIYVIYSLLRNAFDNYERNAKVSAIFAIMGLINIPIIKFSVYLWNTLHQKASIIKLNGPSVHISMLYPLILMLFGILSFSLVIILIKIKTALYVHKVRRTYFK